MFLETFLLALAIAGASCEAAPGKGTYKRMLFTAQVWPSFVYKVAPAKCQRPVDCVGLCSLESNLCSISFHDELQQLCLLGSFGGNYSLVQFQNRSLYGYANLGKTKGVGPGDLLIEMMAMSYSVKNASSTVILSTLKPVRSLKWNAFNSKQIFRLCFLPLMKKDSYY